MHDLKLELPEYSVGVYIEDVYVWRLTINNKDSQDEKI
jgi:hypothetical protein